MSLGWLIACIACGVLLFFFGIYLFLIGTGCSRRKQIRKYSNAKFAHRGLHDATRAENSLSAFARAVELGYGIELDVRLSKDGELVVFHDDTLERVCGVEGRVDEKTLAELRELRLCTTKDTVPTFAEVLSLVGGKVPLLVEIKEDAYKYGVTEKCAAMLSEYSGEYIVESFNPLALARFRKLMPSVPLGLLCESYLKNKRYRKPMYFILEIMALNFLSRPDFIAYNHQHWKNATLRLVSAIFRPVRMCWTVRTEEEERLAKKHKFTGIIFENYLSEKS